MVERQSRCCRDGVFQRRLTFTAVDAESSRLLLDGLGREETEVPEEEGTAVPRPPWASGLPPALQI